MRRVFKFGGALMRDASGIDEVAQLISKYSNDQLVVVVSALGKTTNALEQLLAYHIEKDQTGEKKSFNQIKDFHFSVADNLFRNRKNEIFQKLENLFQLLDRELKREFIDKYEAYDRIVIYGELFSSLLVDGCLHDKKIKSHLVDARTIIHTDSNFTNASVDWKNTQKKISDRLLPILENNEIVLTQGFIGADDHTKFTTLGREGSDFTATIIANIIDAEEVTIWKDVPGLMNADPKRFEKTIKLDQISYQEAIELVYYGASVIHPKTIHPLKIKKIPLLVRSFYNPESSPSIISHETSMDDKVPKIIVKDNQVSMNISMQNMANITEDDMVAIFRLFSEHKTHINLMQHSAVNFSACFDERANKLGPLVKALSEKFAVKYETDFILITIRHYNGELINELTIGKKIYFEQKDQSTIQLLTRVQ
ncbi:MAG TPA: aspartate kinase [Bacteroidales bacterium]